MYNHGKPDLSYVERSATEMINISGALVRIHKRVVNATIEENTTYNDENVWEEDPDPIYANPIDLKGYFKPEPKYTELTRWGIDTPMKVTIVFSRSSLLNHPEIGDRLIIPGDVIQIPYNHIDEIDSPLFVRVLNATPFGNYHYRWIYHQTVNQVITGDEALRPRLV